VCADKFIPYIVPISPAMKLFPTAVAVFYLYRMSELVQFDYEGQPINFEFSDGNKMINATEMIKAFPEKRINNFLRTQQTKDFILLLEERYAKKRIAQNSPKREVLRVVKGGDASEKLQGTWMDEKLALKFAGWLSARFELWVYDRIQELLTTGQTSLQGIQPVGFAKTLRLLAEQWEKQEKINQEFREELDYTVERLGELEAKIATSDEEYYTVKGYCSLHGILCPDNQARSWGKTASQLSKQKDYTIGKAYDMKWGEVNAYHKDILKEVIE